MIKLSLAGPRAVCLKNDVLLGPRAVLAANAVCARKCRLYGGF